MLRMALKYMDWHEKLHKADDDWNVVVSMYLQYVSSAVHIQYVSSVVHSQYVSSVVHSQYVSSVVHSQYVSSVCIVSGP
jgi:hypothetical protein